MRALLESADGLKGWLTVPDEPPYYYVMPLIEPIRPLSRIADDPPPNIGIRRYVLQEIRYSTMNQRYAYYREELTGMEE